jgi:trimeric autotransporter adhesin
MKKRLLLLVLAGAAIQPWLLAQLRTNFELVIANIATKPIMGGIAGGSGGALPPSVLSRGRGSTTPGALPGQNDIYQQLLNTKFAASQSIATPDGIALDGAGGFYVASPLHHRIYWASVDPSIGMLALSVKAGGGTFKYGGGEVAATEAQLLNPSGIAIDSAGALFFTDSAANRICKVKTDGVLSIVAGSGSPGFSGDGGPATSSQFHSPQGIAVDSTGNLYIADTENNRIRKVTPDGIISTVAGNAIQGYAGDGKAAAEAQLNHPQGIAVDSSGNIYFADTGNRRIRKVTPKGIISTLAGGDEVQQQVGGGISGFGYSVQFGRAAAVAVDAAGNIYIADAAKSRIYKATPDGKIATLVEGTGVPDSGRPAKPAATIGPSGIVYNPDAVIQKPIMPNAIAVDRAGNIYILDGMIDQIRKATASGLINIAIGN